MFDASMPAAIVLLVAAAAIIGTITAFAARRRPVGRRARRQHSVYVLRAPLPGKTPWVAPTIREVSQEEALRIIAEGAERAAK